MEREFSNIEREELMISVMGTSSSGKSTIIAVIENALREKGFDNVELRGSIVTDGDYEFTQKNLDKKIEGIKKFNKKIYIAEVQAVRSLQ